MSDYKLVPVEPTPEMEQAAEKYWNERKFKALSDDPRTWKGLYTAMLAAAPTVQGEPVGWVNSDELDNMLDDRTATLFPVRTGFHGKPVYAAPQPAEQQPEPDVAKMQRKLEASFQREEQLEREVRELKREKFKKFRGEECWIWAGDASDKLETLMCPVVISPSDLLEIISRAESAPDVAGLVEALELARADIKEWLVSFPGANPRHLAAQAGVTPQ